MAGPRHELRERAVAVRHEALTRLDREQRGWLAEVPVTRMLEAFDALPPGDDFTMVSAEQEAVDARVSLLAGDAWLGPYYRFVLLELLVRALSGPHQLRLPEAVEQQLLADDARIVEEAALGRTWPDPLTDGDYLLDIGLARGTVLPFALGIGTFAGNVLRTHLRASALDRFDLQGSERSALEQADLLELNPQIGSLRTTSWILDPALAEVSPHLTWLRQWLVDAGGILRRIGTEDHVVENALATSRTRRRLYEEGRYTPTAYEIVWERESMISWAARCRAAF
jgi:hypothetical protein